ncbi:MAG TPA: PilZ domain-containing protein [Candidatus Acidoferrum sp.]|nr:PilZ domain-containing protein [Candidatus Acidoferrum sp.]
MDSERRQAPRYPFIAEAEVTEIASDTKLVAKTSDLSVGGCFLDMLNPSPQGTDVRVRISHQGATFTALGRVAFILPNMGMGVTFTSVEQDQQAILQKWISNLSRAE